MYSTCLFCNSDLGSNEALEPFPVGKRLAFDAHKGRLWVVCRRCERWNLSPLEERWEAIEQAERHFSVTRQRVSTENIGLARLRDGTELVRIGAPQRPEFAAWRYGDQFGRRRRRQLLIAGGGLGVIGAVVASGVAAGAGIAAFGGLIGNVVNVIVNGRPEQIVAHIRTDDAGTVAVRRRHLAETSLLRSSDEPFAMQLRYKGGSAIIRGREALRVAATIVPHVNRYGGKPATVQSAVGSIEAAGGVDGYLAKLNHEVTTHGLSNRKRKHNQGWSAAYKTGLFALPVEDRLALEMALHEEAELRALRGELADLERAWREAEEIAAIADGLTTPPAIDNTLDKLRQRTQDY